MLGFKAAIAARNALGDNPPSTVVAAPTAVPGPSAPKTKLSAPAVKKKAGLKGVVVKKKKIDSSASNVKSAAAELGGEGAPQKRRKVSESSIGS